MDFVTPESEYEKDPKLKKDDVEVLREWMRKQPHLPNVNEVRLIHFLQSNYYKLEPAKNSIENYYTIRAHVPEFFAGRDPTSARLSEQAKVSLVTVLPARTKEGYPVLFARLMDAAADRYDFNEQIKLLDMYISLYQSQIGTSPGQVLVLDADGYTFGHVVRSNPSAAKKHMYYIQEALPVRLKAVHVINVSAVTEKFTNVLRPFIKKEIFELVRFHKRVDGLYESVPVEAMPAEYGGAAGSFAELHAAAVENLRRNAAYFVDEEGEVADERRRVGKRTDLGDVFGIEGTFKKLELD